MTEISIEVIERLDDPRLDAVVAQSPDAMFYQSTAFLKVLENTLAAQPVIFLASITSTVEAFLPAFRSVDRGAGTVLNSLPFFGSHGGAVLRPENVGSRRESLIQALVEAFYAHSRKCQDKSATLVMPLLETENNLYRDAARPDAEDKRIGQVSALPAGSGNPSEHILAKCHGKARNQIRKGLAQGFDFITTADDKLWDYFIAQHQENITGKSGLVKPSQFFATVREQLTAGRDYELLGAKKEGTWAAAVLLFYFRDWVEYYTPALTDAFRPQQALPFLLHEAMVRASRRGFKRWNWGGTWLNQNGVHHFKSRWGATEHPYSYFTRIFNQDLRRQKAATLLERYPYFYVIPFSELKGGQSS